MTKNLFFGIWEFIFFIILSALFYFFIWPAIYKLIVDDNQRKFDSDNNLIIEYAKDYVNTNSSKFEDSDYPIKLMLSELKATGNYKMPVKNDFTRGTYDLDKSYVSISKVLNTYSYELFLGADYSNAKPLLSSRLKIGDYIDYPAKYSYIQSEAMQTNSRIGWRVLSIDNGVIKIISALQIKLYTASTDELAYLDLNNFNNYTCDSLTKDVNSEMSCFGKIVLTNYSNNKVGILSNKDVAKIALSSNLRTIGSPYWISKDSNIELVDSNGNMSGFASVSAGVRPVITLKTNLRTTGTVNGKWQIVTK